MQYPGQFPEFEGYVDFHLRLHSFKEYIKEREWVVSKGLDPAEMSKESDYRRFIAKFNLDNLRKREKEKSQQIQDKQIKKKNNQKKKSRAKIYNRLMEYHLNDQLKDQQPSISKSSRFKKTAKRGNSKILEAISEENSSQVLSHSDVYSVSNDKERLI